MVSGIRVSIHVLRLYMTFFAVFYSIYSGLMFFSIFAEHDRDRAVSHSRLKTSPQAHKHERGKATVADLPNASMEFHCAVEITL